MQFKDALYTIRQQNPSERPDDIDRAIALMKADADQRLADAVTEIQKVITRFSLCNNDGKIRVIHYG